MLSRSSSDKSHAVRRTKSASSVAQRTRAPAQDGIDPETARKHAVTAANIAMGRAMERKSAELRRSVELVGTNSILHKSNSTSATRSRATRLNSAAELRRQRSVLRQRDPSLTSSSLPREGLVFEPTAVPPINDFGMPNGYGSTPSSYRRLRKAKSMLTTNRRALTIQSFAPKKPRNQPHTISGRSSTAALGMRRSLSFLKGSSRSNKPSSRTDHDSQYNDAAIKLARDQFLHDLEEQRAKSGTSFSLASRIKRHQKPIRKTVRSKKSVIYGETITSEAESMADRTFPRRSRVRSLSLSIKTSVMRIFTRSSGTKDEMPVQQLEASRPHFKDYGNQSLADMSSEFLSELIPEIPPRARLRYPTPSDQRLGMLNKLELLLPNNDASRSSESLTNTQSRLSSWTDSSVNGALSQPPIDRKRLSIIQEHGGPYHPSSSAGRHLDSISLFKRPIQNHSNGNDSPASVDSQRVYSALMRRIGETEPTLAGLNRTKAEMPKEMFEGEERENLGPQATSTIRAVSSGLSLASVCEDPEDTMLSGSLELSSLADDSGLSLVIPRRRRDSRSEEARSSFFPFSSEDRPDVPSPFKLALAARRQDKLSSGDQTVVHNNTTSDRISVDSGSQYSRSTGGHVGEASLARDGDENEQGPIGGMATVFPDASRRYAIAISPSSRYHHPMGTFSLADEPAIIGHETDQENLGSRRARNSSFSDQTHYRESAQIHEDDTTVGKTIRPGRENQPAAGIIHREITKRNRSPLVEIHQVPRSDQELRQRYGYNNGQLKDRGQYIGSRRNENIAIESRLSMTSAYQYPQQGKTSLEGPEEKNSARSRSTKLREPLQVPYSRRTNEDGGVIEHERDTGDSDLTSDAAPRPVLVSHGDRGAMSSLPHDVQADQSIGNVLGAERRRSLEPKGKARMESNGKNLVSSLLKARRRGIVVERRTDWTDDGNAAMASRTISDGPVFL